MDGGRGTVEVKSRFIIFCHVKVGRGACTVLSSALSRAEVVFVFQPLLAATQGKQSKKQGM